MKLMNSSSNIISVCAMFGPKKLNAARVTKGQIYDETLSKNVIRSTTKLMLMLFSLKHDV